MNNTRRVGFLFLAAAVLTIALFVHPVIATGHEDETILSIDYPVPHVSTVPANEGDDVVLFVRERVKTGKHYQFKRDKRDYIGKKVVLFVHGGTAPSVAVYDLPFEDYNWAEYLANAGFDVFMMDLTGYGFSPRPEMDDPCNTNPDLQDLLVPNPLAAPCDASYPYNLNTSQSEWDEINTVVDFIRDLRGVKRLNLIGWSAGGPRIGGFAAQHPDKVDKLYFYAGSVSRTASSNPPDQVPAEGFPMSLQSYDALMYDRWQANVGCVDQVNYEIRPVVWNTIMRFDTLGSTWGDPAWNPIATPEGGLMRTRTSTSWDWNSAAAASVKAPSLLIAGEFDMSDARTFLYEDLGSNKKVFIKVACASHFMVWETQHRVLLETSKEWFLYGSINRVTNGILIYDVNGRFHKE